MAELAQWTRDIFRHAVMAIGLCLIVSASSFHAYGTPSEQDSTWKVFRNRAGWSIAYPPAWKISSCHSCPDPAAPDVYVDFFPPSVRERDEGWVMVEHLADKPSAMRPYQWLSRIMRTNNLNPVLNERRLKLNGLSALKVVYVNRSDNTWQNETTYVVSQGQTFAVSFNGKKTTGTAKPLKNYAVYMKMLSTFQIRH